MQSCFCTHIVLDFMEFVGLSKSASNAQHRVSLSALKTESHLWHLGTFHCVHVGKSILWIMISLLVYAWAYQCISTAFSLALLQVCIELLPISFSPSNSTLVGILDQVRVINFFDAIRHLFLPHCARVMVSARD